MSEREARGRLEVGYWDESLRDARECGEVLVVRGEVVDNTFELDVVTLRVNSPDPFGDACERAFGEGE